MTGLVNPDGTPLRKVDSKRRRSENMMKKTTNKGDVLFKLIVDAPKEVGTDEFNRLMYEYFSIGAEAFKAKL